MLNITPDLRDNKITENTDGDVTDLETKKDGGAGIITSCPEVKCTSSKWGLSLCKSVLMASVFFSALEQTSSYVIRPFERIYIEFLKLSVKYFNIRCLMKNLLKFGESDLLLCGIDIKSDLALIGTSPEQIMSMKMKYELGYRVNKSINLSSADDISDVANEEKMRHLYNKVGEVLLKACVKVQNSSLFDAQSRCQLGKFLELVKLNDSSYHPCPNIVIRNDYSYGGSSSSLSLERPVIIIVIIINIVAFLYLVALSTRKIRKYAGYRRLRNT